MSDAARDIVIRLHNVVRVRTKGGQRFELHVPRFEVPAGQFVAIVGESGCGKSTLLDMLALVLSPTSADTFEIRDAERNRVESIMGLGERGRAAIRQSLLGYVLQTGGLLPFLSVRQNILLPCRLNGIKDGPKRVEELAQRLGIAAQLDKKPAHLSGGQRQRVAIARALAHRPPIVLADEPTAAVDRVTAREIRDTFREITHQMGVTLLMVTHDLALVEDVVDRMVTFDIQRPETGVSISTCREAVVAASFAASEKGARHGRP